MLPGCISDENPPSFTLNPNPLLDINLNLFDIDLFQNFDYRESYTLDPVVTASYTFNQDILIGNGTSLQTLIAGSALKLDMATSIQSLTLLPTQIGQDLSQLTFSTAYGMNVDASTDLSFGLGDTGVDITILEGSIKSFLFGELNFGPVFETTFTLQDLLKYADLDPNLTKINFLTLSDILTTHSVATADQVIVGHAITHDSAMDRWFDARYLTGGAAMVVGTNLAGSTVNVTTSDGLGGQAGGIYGTSGDGGHGGYAGGFDVSESVVGSVLLANLGVMDIVAGNGGDGSTDGIFGTSDAEFDGDGGNGGDAVGFDLFDTDAANGFAINNAGILGVVAGDGGLAGDARAANGYAGVARGVDARLTNGRLDMTNSGVIAAFGGDTLATDRTGGDAFGIDASTAAGPVVVLNSGVIQAVRGAGGAGDGGAWGILTGAGNDIITNRGRIDAGVGGVAIDTGAGDDVVRLLGGTRLVGSLLTGLGDDGFCKLLSGNSTRCTERTARRVPA